MVRDRVHLRNDSEEPLELGPGESIPAILLFDPQIEGNPVVHYYPREDD